MTAERSLKVVVVDDDFMISQIHQRYVDSMPGFTVVGVARTAAESLALMEDHRPDVMLLDVYLPDRSGIELLSEIRVHQSSCDVILLTAANELGVVEAAFRFGVFDYLVKPFTLDALGISLRKYSQYKSKFEGTTKVDQAVIDSLKKLRATKLAVDHDRESGIDVRTLDRIKQTLDALESARSAEEIAQEAGVSRSTARVYLDYMVEMGLADERLSYGTVGRPRRMFHKPT